MKLVSILAGRSVRMIMATSPIGGIYIPDAVKALKERYEFVKVPTNLDEYDTSKGVTFAHGKFVITKSRPSKKWLSGEMVIDHFQIYNNGLLVDTKAHTDDADLFLDDIISWSTATFGIDIHPGLPIRRQYVTQFEVDFGDAKLPDFQIGKKIEELLRGYGQEVEPFETSGLAFHCDLTKMQAPLPAAFTVARREGLPYSSNIYFSSAPLSTDDHLTLLKEVEKSILKLGSKKKLVLRVTPR